MAQWLDGAAAQVHLCVFVRKGFIPITAVCLGISLLLTGCERSPLVQKRLEEIRRFNAAMDEKFSAKALEMIRRQWLVEQNDWYGTMHGGAVARLERPNIEVNPLRNGRPFYSGWAADIIVSSPRWESRPPTRPREVFRVKYRATFRDLKTGEIEVAEGPKMTKTSATELLMFQAAANPVSRRD